MTAGFSGSDIEKVRSSTDISSVIGRFVSLKKSGRSFKGLCPFHKEKTPSFFVSPERQMYHCFGCGAGGDVFSFLMNYLSLTFPEALEELAVEAGIELSATRAGSDRTDAIRTIIKASQDFFRKSYLSPGGKTAREYIASRKLEEYSEELGIGFAPDGNVLLRFLRNEGYSESVIMEAGMVSRSASGSSTYDRFRNRITFPIGDRRGRPVSFGARVLGDGEPKYLNGPESPVYSKGSMLYGFRQAADAARDLDMVILVEGYFDHARLWAAGFHSTVATCGTALTPAQARRLGSISTDIFICFDSDSAGYRAAVRAAETILGEGFYPRIISLSEGMDPDDYVCSNGADAFYGQIRSAGNPIEFCIGLLGGWVNVPAGKKQVDIVKRLVKTASFSRDPVVRENLLRTISELTGYSLDTLTDEIEEIRSPVKQRTGGISTGLSVWDRDLLRTLLGPDGLENDLIGHLDESDFSSSVGRKVFISLGEQAVEGFSCVSLVSLGEELSGLVSGLASDAGPLSDDELNSILRKVNHRRLETEKKRLQKILAASEGEEKLDLLRNLSRISAELIKTEKNNDSADAT